jgi:hypothetical protein
VNVQAMERHHHEKWQAVGTSVAEHPLMPLLNVQLPHLVETVLKTD